MDGRFESRDRRACHLYGVGIADQEFAFQGAVGADARSKRAGRANRRADFDARYGLDFRLARDLPSVLAAPQLESHRGKAMG